MTATIEIIMCPDCNGTGTIERNELTDYHRVEYCYWNELCKTCKGSGRLERRTEITTIPYENPHLPELIVKELQKTK